MVAARKERMMPASTTISFVRHGDFENPDGVYHGRLPGFPLSEQGRREAEAVAAALASNKREPVAAIYTSPMLRTQQTAAIIEAALEPPPPVQEISLLNEINSPFDGSPRHEMDARDWDFYTGTSFPYEQPQDVLQRVLSFIQRMRRQHAGEHVVAVTHADPLAFLWLWLFDEELSVDNRKRLDDFGLPVSYPETASISQLRFRSQAIDEKPRHSYRRPYENFGKKAHPL
jgi:broad specificity phosphatase PhoE